MGYSSIKLRIIIKPIRKRKLKATDKKVCGTKKRLKVKATMGTDKTMSSMHQDHHFIEPNMKKMEIAEQKQKPCLDHETSVNLDESYTPILWWSTGRNIFDCYDLREKLGSGGYGTTHMCIEKATGQRYACKVIDKGTLITEQDQEDVCFEINMMAHLNLGGHRNIIRLVDSYEDSKKVYIVMELCQGGDLFDRMQRIRFYTEDQAASVMTDIVQAIKYCHEHHIMHRDIKPENILYSSNNKSAATLKLIDFGLSTYFKPGQKFTEVVGTTCYMAPEVITGQQYGEEIDIWSAGVILYTLLAGEYPFFGEDEEETREAVMNYEEMDFDGGCKWECISSEAKDLVKGMLNRDPEQRLTVQQILEHPWFVKQEAENKKSHEEATILPKRRVIRRPQLKFHKF